MPLWLGLDHEMHRTAQQADLRRRLVIFRCETELDTAGQTNYDFANVKPLTEDFQRENRQILLFGLKGRRWARGAGLMIIRGGPLKLWQRFRS